MSDSVASEKKKSFFSNESSMNHNWFWRKNDLIIGKYRIERILEGDLFKVYIVRDEEGSSSFAIKTFSEDFQWEAAAFERFTAESLHWEEIGRHTNIVSVNFVLSIMARPCVFMDIYEGQDLGAVIGTAELTTEKAIDYSIQICSGMHHAYIKKGIVHGDLTPGNIIIGSADDIRIMDFGLIRAFDRIDVPEKYRVEKDISRYAHRLTKTGYGMGIPLYMSPEQEGNRAHSHISSDIFSFGVLLYEMLAAGGPRGSRPWQERMNKLKAAMKKGTDVFHPGIPNASAPQELNDIILRSLKKNPEERFGSFEEISRDLMNAYKKLKSSGYELRGKEEPLSSGDLCNKGRAQQSMGNYDSALQYYKVALELNPNDVQALTLMGQVYHAMGKLRNSINCLNNALKINPGLKDTWISLGQILSDMGRNTEAIQCFNKAIEIEPNDGSIYLKKGICLSAIGIHNDAITSIGKAIELDPGNAESHKRMGISLQCIHMHNEARDSFLAALKLREDDPATWYQLGHAQICLHQHEEALVSLERALTLRPGEAQAWNKKGQALSLLGRHNEALVCFNKALMENPRLAEAWNKKGESLLTIGRINDAVDCFNKALDIDPRLTEAWSNKGTALGTRGSYCEAVECFSKALAVDPLSEVAKKGVVLYGGMC